MPPWLAGPLIVIVAFTAGGTSAALVRRYRLPPQPPYRRNTVTVEPVGPPAPADEPILLAPAPTVWVPGMGWVVLRDWLRHYSPRAAEGVWKLVVGDFYGDAAGNPVAADYFGHLDEAGMAKLQSHFVVVIMHVTGEGLTDDGLDRLIEAHRDVRNSRGEPITPEVFDIIVRSLGQTLGVYGVPGDTIAQLVTMTSIIREAMTSAPTAA